MKRPSLGAAAMLLAAFLPGAANAQHAGHMHGGAASRHAAAASDAAQVPTEGGQSAFAALSEIVALLVSDPATDWERVDIDALRAHLADMDQVTLRARSETLVIEDGARFAVSGPGETGESVRRMTLAHAPFLEAEADWRVTAEPSAEGAILTVRADDPALAARIRALGFFGLMTLGAHHPEHHLAIARGQSHAVHATHGPDGDGASGARRGLD